MITKNDMFRYYIYGYLNTRIADSIDGKHKLKEKRIDYLKIYLNLTRYPKWLVSGVICCLVKLELALSVTLELVQFLYCVCIKIFNSRKILRNGKYYYGIKEQRLKTILKNAHIQPEQVTIITSKTKYNKIFTDFKQIPLLRCISLLDVVKSFLYSIQTTCLMHKKYGKTDVLFRSFASFEFYMVCFCFSQLDDSNEVIYTSTYSRWGYLFGNLFIKTVFLQHGMLGNNLPYLIKAGCPTVGYFLNEEEKSNCCRQLFSANPETHYLEGLKFTSNEKLMSNGKRNVLIVCNLIHFDKEAKLAKGLYDLNNYNIYLKPHPLDTYDRYMALSKEVPILILNKKDYPKVDLVVSYNSTLAIEYRDAGVKVIWHDEKTAQDIIKEVNRIRK